MRDRHPADRLLRPPGARHLHRKATGHDGRLDLGPQRYVAHVDEVLAHALINGGGPGGVPAPEPIWGLADDLASELSDFIAGLEVASAALEKLASLAPGPDEEGDGEDLSEEE